MSAEKQQDNAEVRKQYQNAIDIYGKDSDYDKAMGNVASASERYNQLIGEDTGTKGYQKALLNAIQGANIAGNVAGNQARTAYRTAGLNKAQAAQLAGNQSAQAMLNNINAQQAQASGMLGQETSGALTGAQLQQQQLQNVQGKAQGISSTAQNLENMWNQRQENTRQNIATGLDTAGKIASATGSIMGIVSDERCKVAYNLNDARECSKNIEKVLMKKNKPDFSALVVKYERKR